MPKGIKGFQKGNKIGLGRKVWNKDKKMNDYPQIGFQKGHTRSIGEKNPMYGKKHTPETIEKNAKAQKGNTNVRGKHWKIKDTSNMSGEKNSQWQGGKSFEPYSIDWTDILREAIRTRDNYICQICGIHQDELDGFSKLLDVHHIDYDKKNCNPNNLVTLCRSCHLKTNINREYWKQYFQTYYEN